MPCGRIPSSVKLPIYHVFLGTQEHWFTTRDELDAFRAPQEEKVGGELAVGDTNAKPERHRQRTGRSGR